MKATIEVPDELYRRVKAKSAMEGRPIREVTVELYQKWVGAGETIPDKPHLRATDWLNELIAIGRTEMDGAPPGPTAREILQEDRNRLEPRCP